MKTKICKYKDHVGERTLPISEFRKHARNKDGLASQCKTCANLINKRSYEKNKTAKIAQKKQRKKDLLIRYREWKSSIGCKCCPETESVCLELHHLIPEEKEINPADMLRCGWGWKRIMTEAKKCVIVCGNCHKKIHYNIINLDDYN